MSCTLVASGWITDWFVIEPNYGSGQPEGSSVEWRAILSAMRERRGESFRRVAVAFNAAGDAHFWSPRNSVNRDEAVILVPEIDAWISRAEKILDAYKQESANEQTS